MAGGLNHWVPDVPVTLPKQHLSENQLNCHFRLLIYHQNDLMSKKYKTGKQP